MPDIPPTQFKDIVENAVSQVELLDGRFAQVSGFRFTWNPAGAPRRLDENGNMLTPGTRVREVSLDDGTVIVMGGAVVTGAPSVTIAVTNFLATAGDQYPFRAAPFATLASLISKRFSTTL